MNRKQNLPEFNLVNFKINCIDSFKFFSLDETIANTHLLVSFYMYCSGQLIHCLKYQEIRTI